MTLTAGLKVEEWTALAAWATFLVLLVSAVYAGWTVYEARKLRREQIRPWVTVSFHFRSNIAFIAVRNLGTTAARDVQLRFAPELVTSLNSTEHVGFENVAMLSESTPVLVPGEERLILLDRAPDRLDSDLPKRHTARVQYSDHRGRSLKPEEFVLDFALLSGTTLPDRGLNDLVGEVAKIRQQLGK